MLRVEREVFDTRPADLAGHSRLAVLKRTVPRKMKPA